MKRSFSPLLLLFLLAFLVSSPRVQARFRYFTTESGLPSNTIHVLLEDNDGFMWAGTQYGLARYNGVGFTPFPDSGPLAHKTIISIAEDPLEKLMWIGTGEGIYVMNRLTWQVHKEVLPLPIEEPDPFVFKMATQPNVAIWAGTYGSGLFRFDLQEHRWDRLSLPFEPVVIRDILVTADQMVWMVCAGSYLYRYNERTEDFTVFEIKDKYTKRKAQQAYTLCEDSFGDIWISDINGDLYKLSRTDMQFVSALLPRKESQIIVRDIVEYRPQELLLATNTGLLLFHTQQRTYSWWDRGDRRYEGMLNDRFIYTLQKDSRGGLWVGTNYGGINFRSSTADIIRSVYPPAGNGMVISCMEEVAGGGVLIGTDDGGLSTYHPTTGVYKRQIVDSLRQNLNVHAILAEEEAIWIGTFHNGLYRLDEGLPRARNYNRDHVDAGDMNVYSIYRDHRGWLWIGTKQGIARYEEATDSFERMLLIGRNSDVTKIIEYNGLLFFGTQEMGLIRYDYATDRFDYLYRLHPEVPLTVGALEVYHQKLYIGTPQGVYTLDAEENLELCREPLLEEASVYGMLADNSGLWITTRIGLLCYDVQEGVRQFTKEDGFIGESFTMNALTKLMGGEILVGTDKGFNAFRPATLKNSSPHLAPKVVITQFAELGPKGERYAHPPVQDVEITAKTAAFSLCFAALNYRPRSQNYYRYRLVGFEDSWQEVRHEGSIEELVYTQIPPGEYCFEVCTSPILSPSYGPVTSLKVKVRRPWQQTMRLRLRILVVALSVCAMVGAVVHNRFLRRRQCIQRRKMVYNRLVTALLEDVWTAGAHASEEFMSQKAAQYKILTREVGDSLEQWFVPYVFLEKLARKMEPELRARGKIIKLEASSQAQQQRVHVDVRGWMIKLIALADRAIDFSRHTLEIRMEVAAPHLLVTLRHDGLLRTTTRIKTPLPARSEAPVVPFTQEELALPAPNSPLILLLEAPEHHTIMQFTAANQVYTFFPCLPNKDWKPLLETHPVVAVVFPRERIEEVQSIKEKYPHLLLIYSSDDMSPDGRHSVWLDEAHWCISRSDSIEWIVHQIGALISLRARTAPVVNTSQRSDPFIARLCDYIQDHLDDPSLDVNRLAQKMHVSRATLFNKLKSALGTTPNLLIQKLRLEKAAELLSGSSLRISEIVDQVGFATASYFSKQFKEIYGVTPKEYREQETPERELKENP